MIAYVEGVLRRIEENSAVVDVNGIGLRVFTPVNEALLRIGIDHGILLHTYFSVREDAMQLYGFLDAEELDLFKMLINVNGIGPKNALAILSELGVGEIAFAIAQGNYKALTKVSGIGTKTAQRIIVDLKDKVRSGRPSETGDETLPEAASPAGSEPAALAEAVQALEALGYTHAQAADAVRRIPGLEELISRGDLEGLIREGLKQLAIL